MRNSATSILHLSGEGLTVADAGRLLSDQVTELRLTPDALKNIQRSRAVLENLLQRGETIYGVNTGFGKLSNQRIEPHEALALQQNLLRSHAVGVGDLLPRGVSRLSLALRIQALAKGYSGVTAGLVRALIELFNRGVAPAIPEQGSVGARGDLAPLAHLALVVVGEGHAFVGHGSTLLSGRAALRRAHLEPYQLQAKEGLSLINGTQISTAILADALVRARHLALVADVAGTMTLEATRSSIRPFDPRIQRIRPHPGQSESAANVRRLMQGSEILPSHAECGKVQDA
jgi:histidine ammonia-lyase